LAALVRRYFAEIELFNRVFTVGNQVFLVLIDTGEE